MIISINKNSEGPDLYKYLLSPRPTRLHDFRVGHRDVYTRELSIFFVTAIDYDTDTRISHASLEIPNENIENLDTLTILIGDYNITTSEGVMSGKPISFVVADGVNGRVKHVRQEEKILKIEAQYNNSFLEFFNPVTGGWHAFTHESTIEDYARMLENHQREQAEMIYYPPGYIL